MKIITPRRNSYSIIVRKLYTNDYYYLKREDDLVIGYPVFRREFRLWLACPEKESIIIDNHKLFTVISGFKNTLVKL